MNFHERLRIFESFLFESPSVRIRIKELQKKIAHWEKLERKMNKEVITRSQDPVKSKDLHDTLKGQMFKIRDYINGMKDELAAVMA